MKSFPFLLCLLAVGTPILAQTADSVAANVTPVSDEPLVIANGKFQRNGQTVPATLDNVLEVVRARFPTANITVIGGEDIVIENLRLAWKRSPNGQGFPLREPPLEGVFAALVAAGGGKFDGETFEGRSFVIHPRREPDSAPQTEIFNLSSFFYRGPPRSRLEAEMAELKSRRSAVEKRAHASKGDQQLDYERTFGEIEMQLEIVQKQLAENHPPSAEVVKTLVAQIQEVSRMTLAQLRPGEKLPEFQFHPGTNLLIVIGSATGVDVTRKVIAALDRNP